MFLNRFFYMLIWAMGVVFVAYGLFTGLSGAILLRPANTVVDSYFYIPAGKGSLAIAAQAENDGLVEKQWHFLFAANRLGLERSLKAGEFLIPAGSSLKNTLEIIQAGKTYSRRLSIPEGYSVAQIEKIIAETPWIDGPFPEMEEGSLHPETYFYDRGDRAEDIASRMQQRQKELLDDLWEARDLSIALKSPDEAIILASIVEKETGQRSERELVAAVFHNRLKQGMRLQSDPTVIYGLTGGLPLGRRLLRSDLLQYSEYNTYRINGLPPTPIANPGEASIRAVLNPAKVPYLYFVADGTGGHAFAVTLKEHNKNVAKWRKIRDSKG